MWVRWVTVGAASQPDDSSGRAKEVGGGSMYTKEESPFRYGLDTALLVSRVLIRDQHQS